MPVSIIIPPSTEPVTLAQIKQHLRLDHADDDIYLLELANAATLHIESHLSKALITRTLRQYTDKLPADGLVCMEAWPVGSITSVTGYDPDGNPVVVSSGEYSLQKNTDPAVLKFEPVADASGSLSGFEIDFIAGYGDTGLDIPANIIRAILVLIAHWYEHRGAASELFSTLPDGLDTLLSPARKVRL